MAAGRIGWLVGRAYRRWALGRRIREPHRVAELAFEEVRRARYCTVVTSVDGRTTARVVEPFRPSRDGAIRFGTDPVSRKAQDIRGSRRCLLVYTDDRRRSAVTLECDAVWEDPAVAATPRFKPLWVAFWPQGPGPRDYVVIACRPTAMEVWHGTAVVAPDPFGRRCYRLELIEGRWTAVGHG